MNRKIWVHGALGVLLALSSSGCTLTAEIATMKTYDPSDGVGADVGDLALRNIMLIINDSGTANLVMSVVNSSDQEIRLQVQYSNRGEKNNQFIAVSGSGGLTRVGDNPDEGLRFSGPDVVAGGLAPLYFQYSNVPGELVLVPVLDGALPEYELLVP